MDWKFILAVFVAFLGAASLNIGKGVQKMKVHVFAQKMGIFRPPHRRDFGIWLAGMGMTALDAPAVWLALQLISNPSITSSMMGLGLVALVLFAVKVIHEKLAPREIVGIAIIIVSTFLLLYFQESEEKVQQFSLGRLLLGLGALVAFHGLLAAFSLVTKKLHGFAFGSIAGSCNGLAAVLVKVAGIHAAGGGLGVQLSGPYLYIAMLSGIGATVFTQVGFWKDRALIVVPTMTSFWIMIPAVLEYFVFGFNLQPIQYVAVAMIISGVIVLCSGASEAVLSGDFSAVAQEE